MDIRSADLATPPALSAVPSGPPTGPGRTGIVFVHGMRTSSHIWERQVEHVRAAGHDAVAVDLPAHGARHRERFSMPRAFEVLDEAATSFDAGTPVVVVGLSLGGYTSLAWAARRSAPGDVASRLTGVVAAGCSSDPKGKPVALFRDVAHLAVTGTAAVRRGLRDSSLAWRAALAGGRSPAGGTQVAAMLGDTPHPGWDIVTDALSHLAGRSSVASTRALRVPVWFVNGARDRLRLEESRHVAAAERGALVVVPDAGHDVNSDAPDTFNHVLGRALRDFARARPAIAGGTLGA